MNDPTRRDVALRRVQEADEILMALARLLPKASPVRALSAANNVVVPLHLKSRVHGGAATLFNGRPR